MQGRKIKISQNHVHCTFLGFFSKDKTCFTYETWNHIVSEHKIFSLILAYDLSRQVDPNVCISNEIYSFFYKNKTVSTLYVKPQKSAYKATAISFTYCIQTNQPEVQCSFY